MSSFLSGNKSLGEVVGYVVVNIFKIWATCEAARELTAVDASVVDGVQVMCLILGHPV